MTKKDVFSFLKKPLKNWVIIPKEFITKYYVYGEGYKENKDEAIYFDRICDITRTEDFETVLSMILNHDRHEITICMSIPELLNFIAKEMKGKLNDVKL